jgi:hypothetical protein
LTKDHAAVSCFSLCHGLVDLASTLVVYNTALVHGLAPSNAVALTVTYDLIAFAGQPIAGLFIDRAKAARLAMAMGIALVLTGVFCTRSGVVAAVAAVGIGNAVFHVAAGSRILSRYPDTATATGIFVGPGALGLSIGFWFGSRGFFPFRSLETCLIVACAACAFVPGLRPIPALTGRAYCQIRPRPGVVLLLLAAIAVRGFAGRTGFAGLQSDALVTIGLGAAACLGKMAGGILADRFGWGRIAIVAIVSAGIGIVFIRSHPVVAFVTMPLFQMTMPVTLVATSAALPGRPAFAFGLTCLALVLGTLPAYFISQGLVQMPVTLAMIGVSGACIIAALRQLGRFTSSRQ